MPVRTLLPDTVLPVTCTVPTRLLTPLPPGESKQSSVQSGMLIVLSATVLSLIVNDPLFPIPAPWKTHDPTHVDSEAVLFDTVLSLIVNDPLLKTPAAE